MGNLSGYNIGGTGSVADLFVQSQIKRRENISTYQTANIKNRSNLQGTSFISLDSHTIAKGQNAINFTVGYNLVQTTANLSGQITSLKVLVYVPNLPLLASGNIKAYIYSVDLNGNPNNLLYESENSLDISTLNVTYTYPEFNFINALVDGRIAVGFGIINSVQAEGLVALICQYEPLINGYIYGNCFNKHKITGAVVDYYGGLMDLSVIITFLAKSASGIMLDRSSFTPQITFL